VSYKTGLSKPRKNRSSCNFGSLVWTKNQSWHVNDFENVRWVLQEIWEAVTKEVKGRYNTLFHCFSSFTFRFHHETFNENLILFLMLPLHYLIFLLNFSFLFKNFLLNSSLLLFSHNFIISLSFHHFHFLLHFKCNHSLLFLLFLWEKLFLYLFFFFKWV